MEGISLKVFLNFYDNWNGRYKLNDDNLDCICRGTLLDADKLIEKYGNRIVKAFGFYQDEQYPTVYELTIRLSD